MLNFDSVYQVRKVNKKWNTRKIGLPPEPISANSLFRRCYNLQLDFLFYRIPFCEHPLTRASHSAINASGVIDILIEKQYNQIASDISLAICFYISRECNQYEKSSTL